MHASKSLLTCLSIQAYLILAVVLGAGIGHYYLGGQMDVDAVLLGSGDGKGMANCGDPPYRLQTPPEADELLLGDVIRRTIKGCTAGTPISCFEGEGAESLVEARQPRPSVCW